VAASFVEELKRRRVFQTIAIYVVGAWVVLQVADLAFESWGLPDMALRPLWIAAVSLFPLALIVGWRYNVTLHGIERTPSSAADAHAPLQKSDYAIIGGILAAFTATAIVAFGQASRSAGEPAPDLALEIDPQSVAVLPFVARGSAEETTFFADGVHDDLLTTLANVSDLKVISRTSVLQYRNTEKNLRQIGRELGAAHVLEGGIQHVGGQVRINVQLIDAATDEHLWAETYDRELSVENLFAIQSEITETIAKALAATLSAEERSRVRRDRTTDLEAFNAFNRGKQLFYRSSFESLQGAVEEFKRAIEIDPAYAQAHARLAGTYGMMANTGLLKAAEALELGRQHIDRAIELDPYDGFAVAVEGMYKLMERRPDENDFRRAIELSPNSPEVLEIYASYLRQQNRPADALPHLERALELDPLSTALFHNLGRSLISLGRFEEATGAFDRIAQIDPGNPYAAHGNAVSTIMSGDLARAAYWSEESASFDPMDYENPATTAMVYASLGDFEQARIKRDEALALGPDEALPVAVNVYLLKVTGALDEAVAAARAALAGGAENRWNSHNFLLRVMRDEALASGNFGEALAWYEGLAPELFETDPQVSPNNISRAADLGLLLQRAGEPEQAQVLLERVVAVYDESYARGAANFPLGIAKVDALALLGRKEEALATMRRLIDDGWRMLWRWSTVYNPNHESLRGDPAYESMLSEIEQDLIRRIEEFGGMEIR
jgi:TolB-like protein/Flp pilus assembly protein TadD